MKLRLSLLLLSGLFIIIAGCQSETNQPAENESETSIGSLQHNVYFYLVDDVSDEEIERFEEGLQELMSIEAIHRYELGIPGPTAERDVTDHEFAYSIFSWFLTLDDYKIYDEHPVHLEFIDEFNHLWADVKVYDSEIIHE